MTIQAETDSPPFAMKEQEEHKKPRRKKTHAQDTALEELSVVVRIGDRRQIFDLALARQREAERRLRILQKTTREFCQRAFYS